MVWRGTVFALSVDISTQKKPLMRAASHFCRPESIVKHAQTVVPTLGSLRRRKEKRYTKRRDGNGTTL
jgi:hypothetical protein